MTGLATRTGVMHGHGYYSGNTIVPRTCPRSVQPFVWGEFKAMRILQWSAVLLAWASVLSAA